MEDKQKKILVCEFITSGGLSNGPLPASLAKEGALMRDAVLGDLSVLNQYTLMSMHDARLMPSAYVANSQPVISGNFNQVFNHALMQADFVWLIAPESGGVLLELSERCLEVESQENGARFIGCGFDTMLIGTSKTLCFEALQAAKIYTLPVYAGEDIVQDKGLASLVSPHLGQWVAKPEDGAGCEGIQLFDSLQTLKAWISQDNRYLEYLAQPYQHGIAASISVLCRNGKGWLLSCNQQHIRSIDGQFQLEGVTVNGLVSYHQRFETIARKVAQMLPDALGYIGVDLIIDDENDKIYVLEINPRLTTSYVGLHKVLEYNPAQLILDCVLNDKFDLPTQLKTVAKKQVKVLV